MEIFWKLCRICVRRINARVKKEASSSKNVNAFDLPFDVITEIMLRLPVKSLIRFKLVCKTWYALVENPTFVDIYQVTGPVITSVLEHSYDTQLYLQDDEGFYKSIKLDSLITSGNSVWIVGICGGLICVNFGEYNYIIGNPAIRDFRTTPKPKLSISVNGLAFLGFSSFNNDYKLVRVIYDIASTGEVVVKAEAYTMTTDIWVEIDVNMRNFDHFVHLIDYERGSYDFIPVVLNNIFYWEAADLMDDMRVVSFDSFTGFYDEINVTIALNDTVNNRWKLIEYEEKLSYIICCGDRRFQLWVLDEYKSSWTWKLTIDSIPIITIPEENWEDRIEVPEYTKCGKLLVRYWYRGFHMNILLYDLNTRETKALSCFDDQISDFYFYTESLRTVKRRKDIKGAE